MWAQLDHVTNYTKNPLGSHLVRLRHLNQQGVPIYLARIEPESATMLALQGENLYTSVKAYLNTMRIPRSVIILTREKL